MLIVCRFANSLSVGLNNKYAEIAQNYQKTGKTAGKKLRKEYQFAYEAYEASLLQMANKCSELAEKSGEKCSCKKSVYRQLSRTAHKRC